MKSRGKQAYFLKIDGKTWEKIAVELGYSQGSAAYIAARRWANFKKRPWPIPKMGRGERAWRLKKFGRLSWSKIAERVGYADQPVACRAAYRYAMKAGKEWPLPSKLSAGEMYYLEWVNSGMTWDELGEEFDRKPDHIRQSAWKWAYRHKKPWQNHAQKWE